MFSASELKDAETERTTEALRWALEKRWRILGDRARNALSRDIIMPASNQLGSGQLFVTLVNALLQSETRRLGLKFVTIPAQAGQIDPKTLLLSTKLDETGLWLFNELLLPLAG